MALRDILLALFDAAAIGLLAMCALSLLPLGPRRIAGRLWIFLLSAWLLGPGLIANTLFKEH